MADGRVMLKWSQRTLYVPYPCIKEYLHYATEQQMYINKNMFNPITIHRKHVVE